MSLNDDRKCKKISSYCQHWEGVKKGKFTCNATDEDTLEACMERLQGVTGGPVVNVDELNELNVEVLKEVSTENLVSELMRRNEGFEFILPSMNIDTIVQFTKERGVKPLYDARFTDLEAEMRRVSDPTRPGIDSFYAATQVDGRPHYLQEPMITFDDMVGCHENRRTSPVSDNEGGTSSDKVKLIAKTYNTRATKKRKTVRAIKQLT